MSRSRRSRGGDRTPRDSRELAWRRIDLHIHTPASADYQDPDVSFLDILRKAEARGADLIAFTDHNSVRGYANFWREIEDLELLEALQRLNPLEQRRLEEYRRLLGLIRVLPGFEITSTFGFHILAIFPEGTSIRQMEHLLLELNVPEDRIDLGTGEVGATSDVLRIYEVLHDAGALVIPAHVNSTHGVAMQHLPFGGQTKIAFTQSEYIDALEATDLESDSRRSTARFFNGSKPEYPRRMHIVQGSDAHRLHRDPKRETNLGVCDRMTEVLLSDVSFADLRELFQSDQFNRIRPWRPSQDPYDLVRVARSEGETIVQAFHERPPQRRGRLSPIVRDVAAFANGNGGTVFVGVSGNPADPVIGVEDPQAVLETLVDDIARYVSPPVSVVAEVHPTGQSQVIALNVSPGTARPHAVLPSTFYVRQERETAIAERDEVVDLVRSAQRSVGAPPTAAAGSSAAVRTQTPPGSPAAANAASGSGRSNERGGRDGRDDRNRRRQSGRDNGASSAPTAPTAPSATPAAAVATPVVATAAAAAPATPPPAVPAEPASSSRSRRSQSNRSERSERSERAERSARSAAAAESAPTTPPAPAPAPAPAPEPTPPTAAEAVVEPTPEPKKPASRSRRRPAAAATATPVVDVVDEVAAVAAEEAAVHAADDQPAETAAEPAAEAPARRPRSRRRRSDDAEAAEAAPVASESPDAVEAEQHADDVAHAADAPDTSAETMPVCDIPYPRTGVEIVASDVRDGVNYHAMHDLRNQKIIGNVTRDSARRLWRYAITQNESNPCDEGDVYWVDDGTMGYWKAYKPRGGDVRYNLVYRHDGHLHVFYGVTDEGMDDAWLGVVSAWQAQRQQSGSANAAAGGDAGDAGDAG